jgi:hypothetical protein
MDASEAAQRLKKMLSNDRQALLDGGPGLDALFSDYFPDDPPTGSILLQARRLGIPKRLSEDIAKMPGAALRAALEESLRRRYRLDTDAAQFAVSAWAKTLNVDLGPDPSPISVPAPSAMASAASALAASPAPAAPLPSTAPVVAKAPLPSQPNAASKKKRNWSWLLWWQLDSAELNRQVNQYDTLKFWQSARGISVCCLAFSIAVTAIFVATGTFDNWVLVDAALMAALAAFIYFGHRWAMIAAMALWTFEKGVGASLVSQGVHPSTLIMQVIWWCIYMHAFFLSFRVEQERRKRAAVLQPQI